MAKTGSSQDVLELLRGLSSTGQTISEQRRILDEQHQKMIERAIQQAQFQAGMSQKEKELAQEKELFGQKEKGEMNRLKFSENALAERQIADISEKILEGFRTDPNLAKLSESKKAEMARNTAQNIVRGKPYPVTPGEAGAFQGEIPQSSGEYFKTLGEAIFKHPLQAGGAALAGAGLGLRFGPWGAAVGGATGLGTGAAVSREIPKFNFQYQRGDFSENALRALQPIFDSVGNGKKTPEEAKNSISEAFQNGFLNRTEALKANDFLDRMGSGETTPRNGPTEVVAAAKAQVQKGSVLNQSKPPVSPDWLQVIKPDVSSVQGKALSERIGGLTTAWDDDQANAMEREIYKVPDSYDRERLTIYLGKLRLNKQVFALTPSP